MAQFLSHCSDRFGKTPLECMRLRHSHLDYKSFVSFDQVFLMLQICIKEYDNHTASLIFVPKKDKIFIESQWRHKIVHEKLTIELLEKSRRIPSAF